MMNNKKKIIFGSTFLVAILIVLSLFIIKVIQKKHNVILIVSDSLRADVLGCYGGEAKTPNIDNLASRGVKFERAYSTSPWTAPSAVSMFTGEYPNIYRNGNMKSGKLTLPKYYVPDEKLILTEVLKNIDYKVMKDIENELAEISNNLQGFEKIKHFTKLTQIEKRQVEEATGITPLSSGYQNMYGCLNFLLTSSDNQPLFILKWINDPHSPYNPPQKYKQNINPDITRLSKNLDFYSNLTYIGNTWSVYEKNYLKQLYIKEVESVDERVGFIIKALKRKRLFDKTFIIFTSDHGELFGEHGEWGHSLSYYEELVKVPLILSGPGIPAAKTANSIFSHIDLMATLKGLLSVDYADIGQGKNFSEFSMHQLENNSAYFVEKCLNMRRASIDAILAKNHKLITFSNNKTQLFKLLDDPNELNDISNESPKLIEELKLKINKIRDENKEKRDKYLSQIESKDIENNVSQETLKRLKSLGYLK